MMRAIEILLALFCCVWRSHVLTRMILIDSSAVFDARRWRLHLFVCLEVAARDDVAWQNGIADRAILLDGSSMAHFR